MSPVDVSEEVVYHSAKPNMLEASDLSVNLVHGQDIEDEIGDVSDDIVKGRDEGQVRDVSAGVNHTYSNLGILALSELLGGMTYSLLSPFYTKEATRKGVSVTETGIVYGSVFFTTIVFSPIFGKYIERIGSRNLFLLGTLIAGIGNIGFGFLQWVDETYPFLTLSLIIRIISAMGEAAFFTAVYPLTVDASSEKHRSKALSVMETLFGLGMMAGPFVGGVLYEYGGFYLPFVVNGGSMVICSITALILFKTKLKSKPAHLSEDAKSDNIPKTKFSSLLKIPAVLYSCIVLGLSGISCTWYLPTLQPFLESEFHLDSVATGALLMVDGVTYALFTPFWGWILDAGRLSPLQTLFIGNLCIIVGYSFLGPAPFLFFIPSTVYMVGIGMTVHGFGVASCFLTTLTLMLSSVKSGRVPDTEQTNGMVTSLWFSFECLGGYLGSAGGGWAYDEIGFRNSTLIVIGIQGFALLSMSILWWIERKQKKENASEESDRLIPDPGTAVRYDSAMVA